MAKEYIEREAVCYQLEKQEMIDGQPRAIRRARRIVEDFPAADVAEVVRCKDCVHYGNVGDCEVHPFDGRFSANYFCADGARMDGDGDA